jgi:hypothetical protein
VPALAITEVVRDASLGAILLEHSYWDGKTLRMSAAVDLERETWGELPMQQATSNVLATPPAQDDITTANTATGEPDEQPVG